MMDEIAAYARTKSGRAGMLGDGLNAELDMSSAFRDAFRLHPEGVAIISTDFHGQPIALTISSLISLSTRPPTVTFSRSAKSSSSAAIRQAQTVVIHLLRLEDMALAQLCASSEADRFDPGVNWTRLSTGEPLYSDVGVWFRARIVNELAVAGATLVVAEWLDGHADKNDAPPEETSLVYLNRRWYGVRSAVPQAS